MRPIGINLSAAAWRKSSYSDGGMDNCVEVADHLPGVVPVRDSKATDGPALIFTADHWNGFINAIKGDAL